MFEADEAHYLSEKLLTDFCFVLNEDKISCKRNFEILCVWFMNIKYLSPEISEEIGPGEHQAHDHQHYPLQLEREEGCE